MKKIKLIMALVIISILTGCGGGSSSSSSTASCDYSSFDINPTSSDAKITVEKSSESACTEVKLTAGSATITSNGYTFDMVLNQTYTVATN
jgi:major membrane immunogen (membrane-anchored lipoprotein)